MPEALELISKRIGREISYEVLPDDQLETALGRDMAVMYRWFNTEGYQVDIQKLAKQWGIPLTRFRDLVKGAEWGRAA